MRTELMEIGFSEYEARAYLALLPEYPATAYEVAKRAGLPTSKIYQVLAKLAERGAILEVEDHGKRKVAPLAPDELLAGYRQRLDQTLANLRDGLNHLRQDQRISYIWNFTEYAMLLDKASRLIAESRERLLVSIWPEELVLLKPVLKAALRRKVKLAMVHFGPCDQPIGQTYPHPIEDTLYAEQGGRGLVIVADSAEVLFGRIAPGGRVEGATSRSLGFVAMAEDYVKHDIYIMKIVQRFDPALVKRFGPNYRKLRDVFHNQEES